MRIIFRTWIDGTISVCNGTNHCREYTNGDKKWFEGCSYSNPWDSHKKLEGSSNKKGGK